MKCNEIHNNLGDAIDGSLSSRIRKSFQEHLDACRACRNAFEFELLGKRIVRKNVSRVQAPPELSSRIRTLLQQEQPATIMERFTEFVGGRNAIPTLSLGVATVAVLIFFFSPQWLNVREPHQGPNDLIRQSLVNFASIQSGELKPTMTTCSPEGVLNFFAEHNVQFNINVMPIENCQWYGAIISEHNGVPRAHIVYKVNDDMMYVYQVQDHEVNESSSLELPSSARTALATAGWYADSDHTDHNVVLWISNGTLCAAVSSMNKQRLMALLSLR